MNKNKEEILKDLEENLLEKILVIKESKSADDIVLIQNIIYVDAPAVYEVSVGGYSITKNVVYAGNNMILLTKEEAVLLYKNKEVNIGDTKVHCIYYLL